MAAASSRILLMEDDPAVGALITDILEAANFEVDGPYPTLSDGAAALADHFPSGAILDIRLRGGDVDLIADDLENYGIPYIFCSGMTEHHLLEEHPATPCVSKLDLSRQLVPMLRKIMH